MSGSWKTWLWRILITAAIIIVIAACFYAEENSRGVNAWQKCEKELTARGESLKWEDYIPAPVPDEKNFYKAPMMAEWFIKTTNPIASRPPYVLPTSNPETTAEINNEVTASNYIAWSMAFDLGFDLMREAVKRPFARPEGDYTYLFNQPMPNLLNYRTVVQTLNHRAKCYLLIGQPDKALADLTLLNNINQTIVNGGKPNLLISAMLHTHFSRIFADAVALGIETHAWGEIELTILEKQLEEMNLLPILSASFRAERASVCRMLDGMTPELLMNAVDMGPAGSSREFSNLAWWLIPNGWIQQNKTVIAILEEKSLESMDITNKTISPYKTKTASLNVEQLFRHIRPWNLIAALCVPNFSKGTQVMARNQTWVDQAQIACALERYRLANGKYPAALSALVPQFIKKIPHDIIGGKLMNYSCTDGENFRLYSIGWNEADDGGTTAHTSDGKEDRESGDWVWRYPTE